MTGVQTCALPIFLPAVAQALTLNFMYGDFITTEGLLGGRTVHPSELP